MSQPPPTQTSLPMPVEVFLSSENGSHQGDEYHNDVTFQLPRPILCPPYAQPYIKLLSFTCPNSWLVINSNNNQLFVDNVAYNVTPGNYSASQLASYINTNLPLSASFDSITLKMTLVSGPSVTLFGSLLPVLGLEQGAYGSRFVSQYTIDLTGVNSIYVLTDFQSRNVDTRSHDNNGSVLARVPVDVPPLGVLQFYDGSSRAGVLVQTDHIETLHIRLEDENRRPLAASIFWEMTIQIEFVHSDFHRMVIDRPFALAAEL